MTGAAKRSKAVKKTKRKVSSNPELDALAVEHGADPAPEMDPPPAVEPDPPPAEPAQEAEYARPGEAFDATRTEFAGIVTGIGFMLCHRAGVTPLSGDEVAMIADPLARLADLYGFKIDGRIGAWLGLGGAVAAVYMARLPELEARRAAMPAEDQHPMPGDEAPSASNAPPGFDGKGPLP